MTKKFEIGWVIWNPNVGFYYGWALQKGEMITMHCKGKSWGECMKNGDRAVKVEIRAVKP